jgi:hypothetical protein
MAKLRILSDIHYAGAAEQARGDDYEFRGLHNASVRLLLRLYRRYVWLHQPLRQNFRLDRFLELADADSPDYVIANGDFSCDSGFVGVSDDAACQSVRECLGKLRGKFAARLLIVFGDHELGKASFIGKRGGMRLDSWRRARRELSLAPFWKVELGNYVLMGVVSSLIALAAFADDTLAEERGEWARLRAEHLAEIRSAFAALRSNQRVLLFCHDPTALPFLWEEEAVRSRLPQIEQTTIGHLHSELILWKSRLLAGMPQIRFLGHSAARMSGALHRARHWRPFHVRLCPALAGIQLLKDGGYCTLELDPEARQPARFHRHRLPR